MSVRRHFGQSLVLSSSVRARSMKHCIVIVLDIPFKHKDLVSLTYILCSIDLVNFYVKVCISISDSCECETLHKVIVLDIPFK